MINTAKKSVLHVAKGQLKLRDDDYRAILQAEAGVNSSVDLDDAGFERVMRRLELLGFVSIGKQRRRAKRVHQPDGLVTPDQLAMIQSLYSEIGWHDLARQTGFNRRCCKKAFPQTRGDAIKVTEGLKAMIARSAKSCTVVTENVR